MNQERRSTKGGARDGTGPDPCACKKPRARCPVMFAVKGHARASQKKLNGRPTKASDRRHSRQKAVYAMVFFKGWTLVMNKLSVGTGYIASWLNCGPPLGKKRALGMGRSLRIADSCNTSGCWRESWPAGRADGVGSCSLSRFPPTRVGVEPPQKRSIDNLVQRQRSSWRE